MCQRDAPPQGPGRSSSSSQYLGIWSYKGLAVSHLQQQNSSNLTPDGAGRGIVASRDKRSNSVELEWMVVIRGIGAHPHWLLNPQDAQAQECTLVYGSPVHTLDVVVPARTTVGQPLLRILTRHTHRFEPQSEQTYR
ncbi:hypothetical protein Tco_1546878 [Tanacetum coccineum]